MKLVLDNLRKNLEFVKNIDAQISQIMQDFVSSPEGSLITFERNDISENTFSKKLYRIIQIEKNENAAITMDFSLSAHGEIEIETTDWDYVDGVFKDPNTKHEAYQLETGLDIDTTVSNILSLIMTRRGVSPISSSLTKYIYRHLDAGSRIDNHPEPI